MSPDVMTPPPVCPHCDSPEIEPMPDRAYEAESAMTWYHCRQCRRMWSIPKLSPSDLRNT